MAITSAAKMRHAIPAKISFSLAREQTILFNHRDADWLRHNIDATGRLLDSAGSDGVREEMTADNRPLFRDVGRDDTSVPLRLLLSRPSIPMRADLLIGYLDEQNAQGYLLRWNIVVMAHPDLSNGELVGLGLRKPVGLIERNRLDMPNIGHANIKSLVSTVDRVADFRYRDRNFEASPELRTTIKGSPRTGIRAG